MHDDDRIDDLLHEFLADELEPQGGRAEAYFRVQADRPAPARPARRQRLIAIPIAAAVALALVWIAGSALRDRRPDSVPPLSDRRDRSNVAAIEPTPSGVVAIAEHVVRNGADESVRDASALPAGDAIASVAPRMVQRVVRWRTLDEGIVRLDDRTAVRKIRRQWVEQVEWVDPANGVRIAKLVPREDVVLVGLPSL